MQKRHDFTTEIITTVRTIDDAVRRSDIALLALNHITSEYSLEYFKDLGAEDLPHNLDKFFEELSTIHDLLHEEVRELREYKLDLEASLKRMKDVHHVQ